MHEDLILITETSISINLLVIVGLPHFLSSFS